MSASHVSALPYPEVLLESRNYTGFAAIYGDHITATHPGKNRDRILIDYCRGKRVSHRGGTHRPDDLLSSYGRTKASHIESDFCVLCALKDILFSIFDRRFANILFKAALEL